MQLILSFIVSITHLGPRGPMKRKSSISLLRASTSQFKKFLCLGMSSVLGCQYLVQGQARGALRTLSGQPQSLNVHVTQCYRQGCMWHSPQTLGCVVTMPQLLPRPSSALLLNLGMPAPDRPHAVRKLVSPQLQGPPRQVTADR